MLANPILAAAKLALKEGKPQTGLIASANEKKWDSRFSGPIPHDTSYYLKCVLGGALSCGSTHLAVTPLDVTKCNMQVQLGCAPQPSA